MPWSRIPTAPAKRSVNLDGRTEDPATDPFTFCACAVKKFGSDPETHTGRHPLPTPLLRVHLVHADDLPAASDTG